MGPSAGTLAPQEYLHAKGAPGQLRVYVPLAMTAFGGFRENQCLHGGISEHLPYPDAQEVAAALYMEGLRPRLS